jgi:hypothetical protein
VVGPAGRHVVVFAGPGGPTPTTVSAWRPARCLVVFGTAFAIPVNRYSREFETVQSGRPLSTRRAEARLSTSGQRDPGGASPGLVNIPSDNSLCRT